MSSYTSNEKLEKDLKRWFFSFALGQVILTVAAAIWFAAKIDTELQHNKSELQRIENDLDKKADITMILEIKRDLEKSMVDMKEDLRYIRSRIDYSMTKNGSYTYNNNKQTQQ